jgi:hypothetical protein
MRQEMPRISPQKEQGLPRSDEGQQRKKNGMSENERKVWECLLAAEAQLT